ncbi:MAG: HRDC domain-containing protein [Verrucomicrobiales bacterium]
MAFRLFQFPVPGAGDTREMNAFLASHRIVSVQQHLVPTTGGGVLTFVVHYADTPTPAPASSGKKIDYKELLTPDQFAVFSRLRDERKKWAESEGVPVYTLFTNDQLADIVRLPVRSLADLARINGIGPARVDKYGLRLIELLSPTAPTVDPTENAP